MKQILLLFSFFLLSFVASAQQRDANSGSCTNCFNSTAQILVYPNPVTEYLSISDENDQVRRLDIFNLMGRQMKTIAVSKGERYNVGDLADGVYFVRLIDRNERVITTQRINKR